MTTETSGSAGQGAGTAGQQGAGTSQTTQQNAGTQQGGQGGSAQGGSQTQQAPPKVDLEKVINDRIKAATGEIQKTVTTKIIKSLGGGDAATENPVHTALIENPDGFVKEIIKAATTDAVTLVEQKNAIRDESARAFTAQADQYPDLKKVKNEVLAEFSQLDPNLSITERMNQASKKVVERFGWKSKVESQNDKDVTDASMSPSDYNTHDTKIIKELKDSGTSFITARKAQFSKLSGREPAKKAD